MRIVIDTNVVISGTFFGGNPRKVLEAVVEGKIAAFATPDIVDEYQGIVDEMIARKQGKLRRDVLAPFEAALHLVQPECTVSICRDPDDNKFLECAVSSRALYIVSSDKDLLDLEQFDDVEIITAAKFCDRYLPFWH